MNIIVVGDYACGYRLERILEQKRYDKLFGKIKQTIEYADISIVNYENPVLLDNKDYTAVPKKGPNLYSRENAVYAIKYAGFNVATLANNHILDYGAEGCLDTVSVLNQAGISTVGAGADISEAEKVLYLTVADKTLAIINCCEHEFSIADDKKAGANPLNPVRQYYSIREARNNADYVIVIVHGGHEYFQFPSLRMQETYRFFVDAGADAVINHHQHCISGYEFYNNKPIIYGLGNFCFDSKTRNSTWNEGYIASLNFNSSEITLNLIPYIQCNDEPGVFPLSDRVTFDKSLSEINAIISDRSELKKKVAAYYESCARLYEHTFEPYTNRYCRKLRSIGLLPSLISKRKWLTLLNMIECESHRDKVLFMMHKNALDNN